MGLLTLEHGKLAYRADFMIYTFAVPALTAFLLWTAPRAYWLSALAWAVVGLLSWTLIEYALHRFVLHGLQPFRAWHEAHHQRPTALICAPTIFSATLIAVLVFLPAWVIGALPCACSLTLGLLVGYLAYATTHHATHHWRANSSWLKARKRWHALHHHARDPACYGVTSSFWDRVFGTGPRVASRSREVRLRKYSDRPDMNWHLVLDAPRRFGPASVYAATHERSNLPHLGADGRARR